MSNSLNSNDHIDIIEVPIYNRFHCGKKIITYSEFEIRISNKDYNVLKFSYEDGSFLIIVAVDDGNNIKRYRIHKDFLDFSKFKIVNILRNLSDDEKISDDEISTISEEISP